MNKVEDIHEKRVIIVHGWADDPSKGWISWLVRELTAQGIHTIAPPMPNPKKPNIEAWVEEVDKVVGGLDESAILVGHSLGVYVLLRYLDGYTGNGKLAKLILVAGFAGHERQGQGKRALPEVDFAKIRQRAERIYSVYSDNDEVLPPEWSEQLGKVLGATNILEPGKGHFAGLHGCEELPSVRDIILS
jgi:predicted alpha/beta hydrolase family esterase